MADFIEIPIDYASKPNTGHVWVNKFWIIKDNCILFYQRLHSPQCNTNKAVSEHLLSNSKMYDGCSVKQISKIYRASCSKYLSIEKKLKS